MYLNYNVKMPDARFYKRTKIQKIVEEFIDSGKDYALIEYESDAYVSVSSALSSFGKHIRKNKLQVEVHTCNGKLYIFRKNV